ncbi:MAG: hypothetical protein AVDCRST_MAG91-488, partial [uncultured Sphingomonadaceae bacterium]
ELGIERRTGGLEWSALRDDGDGDCSGRRAAGRERKRFGGVRDARNGGQQSGPGQALGREAELRAHSIIHQIRHLDHVV